MDKERLKEIWCQFVESQRNTPELGQVLAGSEALDYQEGSLTIYIPDEENRSVAANKWRSIANKLGKKGILSCTEINFIADRDTIRESPTLPPISNPPIGDRCNNPLQVLWHQNPVLPEGDREEPASRMKLLEKTISAESACREIYDHLNRRTELLTEGRGINFSVNFAWRVRVGGTRGFRELLFPVFHPVFGVPYIPASSLKGAALAWAKDCGERDMAEELLGMLKGKKAKAAKIEFLDAFPTCPSLSLDIANPQWHWEGDRLLYGSVPHVFLSQENPKFLIGLVATERCQEAERELWLFLIRMRHSRTMKILSCMVVLVSLSIEITVGIVRGWLESALMSGIGSRVSAGYGRAIGAVESVSSPGENTFCRQSYEFGLWTEGIHGASPKVEFRPTAARGMLRYWFRAVALAMYSLERVQVLENALFGAIQPEPEEGSLRIGVKWEERDKNPYYYTGRILLEAKSRDILSLAEKLLYLSSHLGGIGRGSRRPLHWNNGRLRGCHWEFNNFILPGSPRQWEEFLKELKDAFRKVGDRSGSTASSGTLNTLSKPKPSKPNQKAPENTRKRSHDILNKQTGVYLIPCPNLIHPEHVEDWQTRGVENAVRGEGLKILYGDERFKGMNKDGIGNRNVGGGLGIPSYVVIQSNFPNDPPPYQVVIVFDRDNHKDRQLFIDKLPKNKISIALPF